MEMEAAVPTSPLIRVRQFLLTPTVGPFIALLLACIFFATRTDRFLTPSNFSFIFQQTVAVGALAIGQTIIILTGGIDLANGAIMSLGAVFMVNLPAHNGVNPFVAIAVCFAITGGFGFINGQILTRLRLPPFIVTLGMLNIVYALTLIYTSETVPAQPQQIFLGKTFQVSSSLFVAIPYVTLGMVLLYFVRFILRETAFGRNQSLLFGTGAVAAVLILAGVGFVAVSGSRGYTPITYGSVLMVVLYFVMWFVLRETAFGRHIYAIGNNQESVRLAGISTTRLLIAVYTLAGLFYGLAALLLVSRTEVGDPVSGVAGNYNLESITAVVLGGTSLFGGRGNILGTLIGALIVSIFRNGLLLMGVDAIYQLLITGILVILAVAIDQLSQRGRAQ